LNRPKAVVFLSRCRRRGLKVASGAVIDPGQGHDLAALHSFLDARFKDTDFPFDSVFCGNDDFALVLIAWLRKRALRVPHDVTVAGFNDEPALPYLDPPLASVNMCPEQLVAAVEQMLLSRLAKPKLPPRKEHLKMRFVWRESAGK